MNNKRTRLAWITALRLCESGHALLTCAFLAWAEGNSLHSADLIRDFQEHQKGCDQCASPGRGHIEPEQLPLFGQPGRR